MAENGSIPISDGSSQNGAGSEADASASQAKPPPRQPRTDRAGTFTFSAWLLEGVVGLCEELQHNDLGLPQEFWTHAYAARREALLAFCSTPRSPTAKRTRHGSASAKVDIE